MSEGLRQFSKYLSNIPQDILNEIIVKNSFNTQDGNFIEFIVVYQGTADEFRTDAESIGVKFDDLGYGFGIVTMKVSEINKLDNLTIFVDSNGLQIDGDVTNVMNPRPIDKKFEAFGWNVLIIDGHNYEEIIDAIEKARNTKNMPTCIIANTIKGKGVSFMENEAAWHGTAPSKEQCAKALKELGGQE